MTEDTMRQLLMANMPSGPPPGSQAPDVESMLDSMISSLRQFGLGQEVEDNYAELMDTIARSFAETEVRRAPPAAAKAVEGLKKFKWEKSGAKDGGDDCSVCLSQYQKGDNITEMPCGHILHSECLGPWLKQTNSCPLCRYELDTDNPEYERNRENRVGGAAGAQGQSAQSSRGGNTGERNRALGAGRRPAGDQTSQAAAATSPPRRGHADSAGSPGQSSSHSLSSPENQNYAGVRRGFLQGRDGNGAGHRVGTEGVQGVERDALRSSSGPRLGLNRGSSTRGVPSTVSGDTAAWNDVDPRAWNVRKLRGVLAAGGISCGHCVEKSELVQLCLESNMDLDSASRAYDSREALRNGESMGASPPGVGPSSRIERSPQERENYTRLPSIGRSGSSRQPQAHEHRTPLQEDSMGAMPRYRHESLNGRSPVVERNTARHNYARNLAEDMNMSSRYDNGSAEAGIRSRGSARDLYNRPSRPGSGTGSDLAQSNPSTPKANERAPKRVTRLNSMGKKDKAAKDDKSKEDKGAASRSPAQDRRNGKSAAARGPGNQDGVSQVAGQLPNSERPGTASGSRPGTANGDRPGTAKGRERSWRSVEVPDSDEEVEQERNSPVQPAEDPFVRLARERDREWRGRTAQMMVGDDTALEESSQVDRYVRLGR